MCLYSDSIVPKKAEQDITCYKLVLKLGDGNFYTPYQITRLTTDGKSELTGLMQYGSNIAEIERKRNHTTPQDSKPIQPDWIVIAKGFVHTYKQFNDADVNILGYIHDISMYSNLHVGVYVFECVIPEGTYYYEDDEEYASDAIIYGNIVAGNDDTDHGYDNSFLSFILWQYGEDYSYINYYAAVLEYYFPELKEYNTENIELFVNNDNFNDFVYNCGIKYGKQKGLEKPNYAVLFGLHRIFSGITDSVLDNDTFKSMPVDDFISLIQKGFKDIEWDSLSIHTGYSEMIDKLKQWYAKPIDVIDRLIFDYSREDYNRMSMIEYSVIEDIALRVGVDITAKFSK